MLIVDMKRFVLLLTAIMLSLNLHSVGVFYLSKNGPHPIIAESELALAYADSQAVMTVQASFKKGVQEYLMIIPHQAPIKRSDIRIDQDDILNKLSSNSEPLYHIRRDMDFYRAHPIQIDGPDIRRGLHLSGKFIKKRSRNNLTKGYRLFLSKENKPINLILWLQERKYPISKELKKQIQELQKAGILFSLVEINREDQALFRRHFAVQLRYDCPKHILYTQLGQINTDQDSKLTVYSIGKNNGFSIKGANMEKFPSGDSLPFCSANDAYFISNKISNHIFNRYNQIEAILEFADHSPFSISYNFKISSFEPDSRLFIHKFSINPSSILLQNNLVFEIDSSTER
ncbi:MAG: hypothetical protein AB8F95_17400, partial [Bacteroidia bacterium]